MVLIPVLCPHCHSDQVIKGGKTGLDHGTGHLAPCGLPLGSPWWTERCWGQINRVQNPGNHRPRFLTEKPRLFALIEATR
jgi:hypothetical protein